MKFGMGQRAVAVAASDRLPTTASARECHNTFMPGCNRRAANRLSVGTLALALLAPAAGAAQRSAAGWITETVHSRRLGNRTVYIALPDGYAEGSRRYPVLVCFDANDSSMFRLWVAEAAYVADNDGGVPPVIAVGIVNGSDRIHDMTPPPEGSSVAQFPNGGGADAFADFVFDEVLPLVRGKYRTLPTTVLAGHSAGGLFALDVAATRPGATQAVVALSPAIWYNDFHPATQFAQAIARSPAPERIFVANGGVNELDIDSATQRFHHVLDSLQSAAVSVAYRRYADLRHSMTPLGFADGFRFVFERVSIQSLPFGTLDLKSADSAGVARALDASERSYAEGARDLLLPQILPERVLDTFGSRLLDANRTSLAVGVFRQNVEDYPESVDAYRSYADGLVAAGDTAGAVRQLRMAIEVGRRTGARVPDEMRQQLARLTSAK